MIIIDLPNKNKKKSHSIDFTHYYHKRRSFMGGRCLFLFIRIFTKVININVDNNQKYYNHNDKNEGLIGKLLYLYVFIL